MWRWLTLTVGLSIASSSFAYMDDYLPMPKQVLQPNVALQTLKLDENTKQLTPTIKITYPNEQEMVLSGVDKGGKPWSFTAKQSSMYEAFQADLDKNGSQDLVLMYPTMGTGSAPSAMLMILTFDETGRPIASEFEGYFEVKQTGLVDLVDTNKNGKAELIYMHNDEDYWMTSLYELTNARWQKLEKSAGFQYPLYTRYTREPNHKAVQPDAKHHPYPADLTNQTAGITGTLKDVTWADMKYDESNALSVETAQGIKQCVINAPFGSFTLLLDTPEERKIVSFSAEDASLQMLLMDMKKQAYPVQLYGQRSAKQCSPTLLWATAK